MTTAEERPTTETETTETETTETGTPSFTVDATDFTRSLTAAALAVAPSKDHRPILQGVHLSIDATDGAVLLTATDSYRAVRVTVAKLATGRPAGFPADGVILDLPSGYATRLKAMAKVAPYVHGGRVFAVSYNAKTDSAPESVTVSTGEHGDAIRFPLTEGSYPSKGLDRIWPRRANNGDKFEAPVGHSFNSKYMVDMAKMCGILAGPTKATDDPGYVRFLFIDGDTKPSLFGLTATDHLPQAQCMIMPMETSW